MVNLGIFLLTLIDGNSLGNEGAGEIAGALKENHTLTTLSLCKQLKSNIGGNYITSEGAKHFESAIKENQALMSLNLEENNLGKESTRRIEKAVKEKYTLKRVMMGKMMFNLLGKNKVYDEGLRKLLADDECNII